METSITCFGGVGEIGGSKIFLEDNNFRMFFDFGKSFGRYGDFFDGVYIKERVSRGILDFLSLDLIPPLRGLIRDDLIPAIEDLFISTSETSENSVLSKEGHEAFWNHWAQLKVEAFRDLRRDQQPSVDFILLSHAHIDHIGDIPYLSLDIPVASTRMTAFISKVLGDTSMSSHSIPYSNLYQLDSSGLLKSIKGGNYISRPWIFLDGKPNKSSGAGDDLSTPVAFWNSSPAQTKSINPLIQDLPNSTTLKFWGVDHSIFGAIGSAIESSVGWIGYSGDLRFHGKNSDKSWNFANELSELKPIALICEGTRLTEPNKCTEEEVFKNCLQEVKEACGQIVVADFAPRNIERLFTFLTIAEETNRKLILQPRDVYLLRAMQLAEPALIPEEIENLCLGIFDDPKSSFKKWEKLTKEKYKDLLVDHELISKNMGDYILAFSLTDIPDLCDLLFMTKKEMNGIYIFSNSPAFDEEQKADLERLYRWTQQLNLRQIGLLPPERNKEGVLEIRQVEGFHASGHAGAQDLIQFVKIVNPKYLIPVHTEKPDEWDRMLIDTTISILKPSYGKSLILS